MPAGTAKPFGDDGPAMIRIPSACVHENVNLPSMSPVTRPSPLMKNGVALD
jgi:hypothetical protein